MSNSSVSSASLVPSTDLLSLHPTSNNNDNELIILRLTQLFGLLSGLVGNSLSTILSVRIQPAAEVFDCTRSSAFDSPAFSAASTAPIGTWIKISGAMSSGSTSTESLDALMTNTVLVAILFVLHFLMSISVAHAVSKRGVLTQEQVLEGEEKLQSLSQSYSFTVDFIHRMLIRAAWIVYFVLLPSSISCAVRLMDSPIVSDIVFGALVGILFWCGITFIAIYVLLYYIQVQWLPVGGWLKTEEVLKIHREEFLKAASKANAVNIQIEALAIAKAQQHQAGAFKKDESLAAIMNTDPKNQKSMSFEDALLGTPEEAAAAMKKALETRAKIEKQRSAVHRQVLEKNRHRALVKGERNASVGKWINSLATEKQRSEAWHLEQIEHKKWQEIKKQKQEAKNKRRNGNNTATVNIDDHEEENKKNNQLHQKQNHHHQHKLRFGALFMNMRLGCHKFYTFELLLTIIFGVIQSLPGITRELGCDSSAYAFTILLFLETLVFISYQPCRSLADNFFFSLIVLANMASGVFLTTANGRYFGFSRFFFQLSEIMILAAVVLKFIVDIYFRIKAHCCAIDTEVDTIGHALDEAVFRGEMNRDIYAFELEQQEEEEAERLRKEREEKAKNEKKGESDDDEADGKKKRNIKDLANMMKQQDDDEEKGILSPGVFSSASASPGSSAASPVRTESVYRVNSSRRIEIDDSSPLKMIVSEEEIEMKGRSAAISRLESYASKSCYEFDDDPEEVKMEKRRVRGNLPAGLSTFLSLDPPKTSKTDDTSKQEMEEFFADGKPLRIGPNGLVEGLSLGPPLPITDLRLEDHSPLGVNNNEDDHSSPTAPLSAAVVVERGDKKASAQRSILNAKDLLEAEEVDEAGKQTQGMSSPSNANANNVGKESPSSKSNNEEEAEANDDGFSFLGALGSRPGEKNENDPDYQPSPEERNRFQEQAERKRLNPDGAAINPDDNYSPPNPLANDSLMRKIDSITTGGQGADVNVSLSTNKKKLQSLDLAGNFLKGTFSAPVIPSVLREHQRNPNQFLDPYFSPTTTTSSKNNNKTNPLDEDFDEDLPIPPVKINPDDYYGAAAAANQNNNNNVSSILNEFNSPSRNLKNSGIDSAKNNNNNNRPLFSGYFAPTPAAAKNARSPSSSPAAVRSDSVHKKKQLDPPLRDRNAERPLLKMFAMQQGVIPATSPSGGQKGNFKAGDDFDYSSYEQQQGPQGYHREPEFARRGGTADAIKRQEAFLKTPSRRMFAEIEEL